MQKLYRFWKKDFLNKLIILVALLIAAVVAVDLFLLLTHKSSGSSFLEGFFPTPTPELKVVLTRGAETAVYQAALATASVAPTMTTMPFTPRVTTTTVLPIKSESPPAASIPSLPASTPVAPVGSAAPTQTIDSAAGPACIPDASAQSGKAIDIIDGYTIKVLIDGLVYTVRYLGIEPPVDPAYATQASSANGKLVFGKEISLIADKPDKDSRGRLLRYVKVDDTFVNLELLQQGLATVEITDLPISCGDVFNNAEKSAREARNGLWKNAPAP
jgi:endonuclease YncB( thermonuclease family)